MYIRIYTEVRMYYVDTRIRQWSKPATSARIASFQMPSAAVAKRLGRPVARSVCVCIGKRRRSQSLGHFLILDAGVPLLRVYSQYVTNLSALFTFEHAWSLHTSARYHFIKCTHLTCIISSASVRVECCIGIAPSWHLQHPSSVFPICVNVHTIHQTFHKTLSLVSSSKSIPEKSKSLVANCEYVIQ